MFNHRNIVKGVITFLLCTVMSACTGFATTQPSPFPSSETPQIPEKIVTETKTPDVVAATVRPSATLVPTIQLTSGPKYTPFPTQIPTSILPTETPGPQSILTEQAFVLKATQIASFPAICDNFGVNSISLSPNGSWLVIACANTQDQTLEIKNKAGKQWVLKFKDYLPEEFAARGMQRGNLDLVHWTSDDAYLYFTSYIFVDVGGGTCFYGFGDQGLYRINVNTGEISAVLPPITALDGYYIAFSPDWSKIAYNGTYPMILDLRTGENIAFDDAGGIVGNMTWSPDGSQLAFSTCIPSEDFNTVKSSALKIYSLETHQSKTILALENIFIRIEFGDGTEQLKIANYDYQTTQPKYSFFDWSSEQLIMPTDEPTP